MREGMVEGTPNKVYVKDLAVHDWYRFVLSFPPHLVRYYVEKFSIGEGSRVLDPFCGTGTTLVECKKLGVESVGIEAHPMTHFASSVKVDWTPDSERLLEHAEEVAERVRAELATLGLDDNQRLRSSLLVRSLERRRVFFANAIGREPETIAQQFNQSTSSAQNISSAELYKPSLEWQVHPA
jgi:hypothetical protein